MDIQPALDAVDRGGELILSGVLRDDLPTMCARSRRMPATVTSRFEIRDSI